MTPSAPYDGGALTAFLATTLSSPQAPGSDLQALCAAGFDQLPAPGAGQTLERWRALASVAAHDLSLCKLYEGHTDALAIIAETGGEPPSPGTTWGMWAAEPPYAKVLITDRLSQQEVTLDGLKAWCSGAAQLSHALLTCWDEDGRQQLVAVSLDQPGVEVTNQGWQAVGMAESGSVEVRFDQARGHCVGAPGGYLQRPGFWHGGGGIAACWFGAAQAIGEALRSHCARSDEPHALAHLGAVDVQLYGARLALEDCATSIDSHPQANAERVVRRLRSQCEQVASAVIEHCGRALGAAPYCRDRHLARLLVDLPVYLRQSHAERDLAALGQHVAHEPKGSWRP